MFYECLEAQSPFPQSSTKAMIDAIMSGKLRRNTYMSEESLMFAKEMLTVDPKMRLSALAVSETRSRLRINKMVFRCLAIPG